jgi:hypothetical protein
VLYYHHRTPELIQKDVKGLKRIPEHLSVILKLEEGGKGGASLEQLVDEVAEIAAWCACAGIPMLSVYERTGKSQLLVLIHDSLLTITQGFSKATFPRLTGPFLASSHLTSALPIQPCPFALLISLPWSLHQWPHRITLHPVALPALHRLANYKSSSFLPKTVVIVSSI